MRFESIAFGFALTSAACVLAFCALSLRLRQRAQDSDAALSDRSLYEQGRRDADGGGDDVGVVGRMLKEAGVETDAASWVACLCAVALVVALLAWKAGGAFAAAIGVFLVALGTAGYIDRAKTRRRALLSHQFIRLLPQLSASVKSSLTFERSLKVCVEHAPDPVRAELMKVIARTSYGMPLVQAMQRMASETGDADIAALAAAMRIQHRFGGSMAAVLDLVADHANARASLQQELRSELAGTKLATWVVACAMPAIFAFMCATNASFSRFYSENPLGWVVLGVAAVMEIGGIVACRHVTRFKV